jgi:rsbT antagonist protein RsbS
MSPRVIPLIHLRGQLIVSIQVELTDALVKTLRDDIADDLSRRNVDGLIIEVSGVDIFDSYIAASVRDIAHIARLMGVETIVAGLDPAMAITLVEMGMSMSGVRTALDLDAALDGLSLTAVQREQADVELTTLLLSGELEGDSR